jgi:hypothetical protein
LFEWCRSTLVLLLGLGLIVACASPLLRPRGARWYCVALSLIAIFLHGLDVAFLMDWIGPATGVFGGRPYNSHLEVELLATIAGMMAAVGLFVLHGPDVVDCGECNAE